MATGCNIGRGTSWPCGLKRSWGAMLTWAGWVPAPRGGDNAVLALPDGLSQYMTVLGVAKAFDYYAEWHETWSL
jgi:hypothetical protein